MTDLRTISPEELPDISEIPEDLHMVVFSPGGPLQAVRHDKLLLKLVAANLVKPDKAALDADLAYPADAVALVFGDATATHNGWYRKTGVSGTGNWVQFEELARNSRILAEAAVLAAQAWAQGTLPGGEGTKSAKEHAQDAGTAFTAAAATVPTLAANLDGVPWVSADGLALTGPAAGLAWSAPMREVLRAIKSVVLDGFDPAERYYIGSFCNNHPTLRDNIVVRRLSDNAIVAAVGNAVSVTRNPDGPTSVVFGGSSGITVRMLVDYRDLTTTGVVFDFSTVTPLLIARAGAGTALARRAQLLRHRNIALDANGAAGTGLFRNAPGALSAAPAGMAARGIVNAWACGTNGPPAGFYRNELPPARSNGLTLAVQAYVESTSGTNWHPGNLAVYSYDQATGGTVTNLNAGARTRFEQITANLRRYTTIITLPATGTLASIGYGFDNPIAGTTAWIGGWGFLLGEGEINADNIRTDDWTGHSTRDSWRDGIDARLTSTTALAAGYAPPFTNRWSNGALDPQLALIPTVVTAPVYAAPASAAMRARSILQALKIGAGGSPGPIYWSQGNLITSADIGQNFIAALLVFSSDGATWPTQLGTFFTDSVGLHSQAVMSSWLPIDANNRLYFATGVVPGPRSGNTFTGQVRTGNNNNLSGSAANIEISGPYFAVSASPIDASTIRQDDWYPSELTKQRIAAAVRNNPLDRFTGRTAVVLGDSIMADYNIPSLIGSGTGMTVSNFAFEGTRMSTGQSDANADYATRSGERIAAAALSGDFTALVNGINTRYSTSSGSNGARDIRYRAQAAAMAAFDWTSPGVIILAFGTNDYSGNVALGAANSTVTTEFNGALNEAIRQLQVRAPNAQILLSTPIYRGPSATHGDSNLNANPGGVFLSAFADAIRNRAGVWSLPVIDLARESGINSVNESTFLLADDLHPSTAGATRMAGKMVRKIVEAVA